MEKFNFYVDQGARVLDSLGLLIPLEILIVGAFLLRIVDIWQKASAKYSRNYASEEDRPINPGVYYPSYPRQPAPTKPGTPWSKKHLKYNRHHPVIQQQEED